MSTPLTRETRENTDYRGFAAGLLTDADEASCRVCECTDSEACPGGCWWVDDPELLGDLCSQCLPAVVEDLAV